MLASRNGIARQSSSTAEYVCLSCRLRSKQRQQQDHRRRIHSSTNAPRADVRDREEAKRREDVDRVRRNRYGLGRQDHLRTVNGQRKRQFHTIAQVRTSTEHAVDVDNYVTGRHGGQSKDFETLEGQEEIFRAEMLARRSIDEVKSSIEDNLQSIEERTIGAVSDSEGVAPIRFSFPSRTRPIVRTYKAGLRNARKVYGEDRKPDGPFRSVDLRTKADAHTDKEKVGAAPIRYNVMRGRGPLVRPVGGAFVRPKYFTAHKEEPFSEAESSNSNVWEPAESATTNPPLHHFYTDKGRSPERDSFLNRSKPLSKFSFTKLPTNEENVGQKLTRAIDLHLSAEDEDSSEMTSQDDNVAKDRASFMTADSSIEVVQSPLELDAATKQALALLEAAADKAASIERSEFKPRTHLERPTSSMSPSFAPRSAQTGGFAWHRALPAYMIPQLGIAGPQARLFHASAIARQQAAAAVREPQESGPLPVFDPQQRTGIRAQLQKWQDLHGHEDLMPDIRPPDDIVNPDEPSNHLTRLPDESTLSSPLRLDSEDEDFSQFGNFGKEGFDGGSREDPRHLRMGDLVELDFQSTESEGLLAVFVRFVGQGDKHAQFFTMTGKWIHVPPRIVQFSIPGWLSPNVLEPLMEHLPDVENLEEIHDLHQRAYVDDLSVPRELAAPIVSKLLNFYNESNEIYRKNARALDDAHNILAHESDLRYGSLVSAATTLLKLPSNKLPLTALFTVRKSLLNAGFAFNMDRRSHRLTGYMQIRSKDQVRMVETVRAWLRQWQDHVATTAGMDEKRLSAQVVRAPKGAQHVYSFIEKAKAIVLKNRENREYSPVSGNVGPSKVRLPITETSECVKVETVDEFTPEQVEIIRFLEAAACSNMFTGLPRMLSLPPLLLHATGLYPQDVEYGMQLVYGFLQEIGTIMPYENKIRFDPHLLLPSSQHSKPLQNLMSSLLSMRDSHNFKDSMEGLRHDWGDMPVYCIDRAGAQEIDDGISIEPAGVDDKGEELHWVHVHIANPTAFFSRDHPLAKMARHMGETIYMPERTYMMLPRWSTQRHFSLAKDRPCLTFSAKLDSEGRTIEKKITPGRVRNVMRFTPHEVNQLLGVENNFYETLPELVFNAGGTPPERRAHKSRLGDATDRNRQELDKLNHLAAKRARLRKEAGGIFFDMHNPDVEVWQNHVNPGLSWDHPWRRGRRTVEGDPIITLRTRGLINWFKGDTSVVDVLVREYMLLACELSASWCAERQIPVIYRGTVSRPGTPDHRKFWQETVVPNMNADGSIPMHVGREYIPLAGQTILRTTPRWHTHLGLGHYSKATSPLRRYGDMILHWQIESALRYEAETGKSLVTENPNANRGFLPFSAPVLETIMLGLQPRESIIVRAKNYAENFWSTMLLFRKFYYADDGRLPYYGGEDSQSHDTSLPPLRMYLSDMPQQGAKVRFGTLVEFNINATMVAPETLGLEEARLGDVWEVQLEKVNVYARLKLVKPLRLVGREGAGLV